MDEFEYLIALVSVIAGLGITRALSGSARLLNARREIAFSWIPVCWTVSVLLWMVAFWWFTFLLSQLDSWSPWLHVFILIYASALYFLLALLHPERVDEGHDMLAHFLGNRKVFFGALFTLAVIDIADALIKLQLGLMLPAMLSYVSFMVLWLGLSIACLLSENRALHRFAAGAFLFAVMAWLSFSLEGIFSAFDRAA